MCNLVALGESVSQRAASVEGQGSSRILRLCRVFAIDPGPQSPWVLIVALPMATGLHFGLATGREGHMIITSMCFKYFELCNWSCYEKILKLYLILMLV